MLAKKNRPTKITAGHNLPFLSKLQNWRYQAALIFLVALTLRTVFWIQWGQTPYGNEPIIDSAYFDQQAVAISNGHWLPDKVFYVPPVYPYILAVTYTIFGHSLDTARLLQNLLGSVNCLLIALLAARIFGPGVGLLAGLMAAFYRPFIFYDSMILKTTWDLLFTALFLIYALRATTARRKRDAALSGIFLGIALLLRGNMIFLTPLMPLWWLFNSNQEEGSRSSGQRKPWSKPDRHCLLLICSYALGVAVCLLPVTASNYFLGNDLVLTGYSSGPNLWLGNNSEAVGVLAYPSDMTAKEGNIAGEEAYFRAKAEQQEGRALKPSEISGFWVKKALSFVFSQPKAWAFLTFKKFLLFWNNHEVPDNYDMTFLRQEFGTVLNAPLLCFGLVAPWAAVGGFVAFRSRNRGAGLLMGVSLVYVLSTLPFIVIDRYRLPLLVILIPFAAHGLMTMVRDFRGRRMDQALSFGVILLAVSLLSWAPLVDTDMGLHENYANLGAAYQNQNDFDKAKHYYEKAIEVRPDYALALHNLGVVLLILGENEQALVMSQRAVAVDPTYSEAYVNLGQIQATMHNYDQALQSYQQALTIDPTSALAYNSLGQLYSGVGDHKAGIDNFQRALEFEPTMAEAYNNLGIAYYGLKKPEQAIPFYLKALELDSEFSDAYNNLGLAYYEVGDFKLARQMYERALTLQPNFLEARNNLHLLEREGR